MNSITILIQTMVSVLLMVTVIQTQQQIDCTKSYLMPEISLEDYREYCLSTFCKCLNEKGFNSDGCAPQWKGNIEDGLAMLWAFDNYQFRANIDCTKYYTKTFSIEVMSETDKQFMYINTRMRGENKTTSNGHYKRFYENIYDRIAAFPRFNAQVFYEVGLTHKNPAKGLVETLLLERYYSSDKVETGTKEYSWYALDSDNYYPISYVVSIVPDYTDPETQTIIIGPMGGRENPAGPAFFIVDQYFNNSLKPTELIFSVSAVDIEDNYYFKLNPMVSSIRLHSNVHTCLGRKISPITNRSVWTGDGCRPQPYHYKSEELHNYLNGNYLFDCRCDFQSIGLNAPDEDPNLEQVKEFEFPRDVKPVKYIEASHATKVTVIICSIFLLICLIFVILIVAVFAYFKFIDKN